MLAAAFLAFVTATVCQQPPPLKQSETFGLPGEIKGHFDHFGVDVGGRRLFATPEDYRSVLVLDLDSGKIIHRIEGVARPHAVLFREDLNRIFVTDGTDGDLKIFDGKTYELIQSVKLLPDADSIGYDPTNGYLYIDNGGGDAHQTYSMLSVVDTTAGRKLADIRIEGETLEAMALEITTPRIFVNNRARNQVSVVDRVKRSVLASWPVIACKDNVAMSLDEPDHRLFVGCRSGQIVVLDTGNGKEVQAVPIAKGVDDLAFDPVRKRIYAACDGEVDVYQLADPDHYRPLGTIPSGPLGRTARLVPELNRYFVAVPAHGSESAAVLVYEVN
jgi:DNA-binding beta-propeller fold protein YncE